MSNKSMIAAEFAFELRSLVADLNRALAELFRPLGITCVQAEALIVLHEVGPVTLKQLADYLVAESGHPSRLISRLEAHGLVTRSPSRDDGRSVMIELTSQGSALAARAIQAREPLIRQLHAQYAVELQAGTDFLRSLRADLAKITPTVRAR